jgi:hypothetical protein
MRIQDGRTISVPIADGSTAGEVRAYDSDGQLLLLLPKGFPASLLVQDLPAALNSVKPDLTPAPSSTALGAFYLDNTAHWTQGFWNGTYQGNPKRAFWIFDRVAETSLSQWFADWAGVANGAIHDELRARGLNENQTVAVGYARDAANVGNCYSAFLRGWSFVTACSSPNVSAACGLPTGTIGCAFISPPSQHNGKEFQPAVFVQEGLSARGPWFARNAVHHEMTHTLGLNHNLFDPCSTIWGGNASDCNGVNATKNLDTNDFDMLFNIYAHPSPD